MKYAKISLFFPVLVLIVLFGVISVFAAESIADVGSVQIESSPAENICPDLSIPTQEEVKQNGYPVNKNGETYGPNLIGNEYVDLIPQPDLLLAQNEEGLLGYVRQSEYPLGSNASSLEEAIAEMAHLADLAAHTERDHYVNMYLEDGITVIGRFLVAGNCGCDVVQGRKIK